MSHRADNPSNIPKNIMVVVTNNTNTQKLKSPLTGNIIEMSSDYGLWDTVAGAFVKPEDTNLNAGK